jgi:hypothetical protein
MRETSASLAINSALSDVPDARTRFVRDGIGHGGQALDLQGDNMFSDQHDGTIKHTHL